MKRWSVMALGMLVLVFVGVAALQFPSEANAQAAGWTTLFDGSNLNNWNTIGTANWTLADGAVQADKGNGFLVSKESYADFQVKVEFWVNDDANSGIFIRCSDPQKVGSASAYEVNIFDKRPDPSYASGAIVNVAKPAMVMKTGGKWNTMDITAQGAHLMVSLNGMQTVDVQDSKHAQGPIALQYGAGVVKFRKVEIRRLM